jgi:hypothetical protein
VLILSFLLAEICAIATYALGPDELMVWSIARGDSLSEILRRNTFEVHPPLEPLIRAGLFFLTDNVFVLRGLYCGIGLVTILALSKAVPCRATHTGALTLMSLLVLYPTIAHTSILLRGYVFLLLFLALAVLLMSRICQRVTPLSTRHVVALNGLLVLAGLSHVSGFIAAPAVVTTVLVCGQPRSAARSVWYLGISLVILGVVAGSVYALQFADGTGAATWRALARSTLFRECAQFNAIDTVTTRIFHLFSFVPSGVLSMRGVFVSGGIGLAIYLISLRSALRSFRWVALFSFLCIVCAASTHLIGAYPLSSPRHMSFLVPAIFLPISHFVSGWVSRFNLAMVMAGAVAVTNSLYAWSGVQFARHPDFSMTRAKNEAISHKLAQIGEQTSAIFASRFAALYLLMKKDSLRTFYMDPFAERFSISHARVAVCVDAPLWQTKRASLEKCISDELTGTDGNEQQPVRLASIGFADNLLAEIRRVGTASGVVTADESTDGMLLFQMPLRAAREGLARISDGGYTDNHCTGPITGP